MKVYFLLSAIFFGMGCNVNDSKEKFYIPPSIQIHIEYFDKEQKGYLQLEGEELKALQKESMSIEILSFTDEITGLTIMEAQEIEVMKNYFGFTEKVEFGTKEMIRHYLIKYKAPSVKGEFVEELKIIFHLNTPNTGIFKEVWYNGKVVPIIDHEELRKRYPNYLDIEGHGDVVKETYYNGDLVAVTTGSQIQIVLTVEKP